MRSATCLFVFSALLLLTALPAAGQFKGGDDDGFTFQLAVRQTVSDGIAFRGGTDDGFAQKMFGRTGITDVNAFKGGSEDGFGVFQKARSVITDASAFTGGGDDGFTVSFFGRHNPADANAFRGGADDGFSKAFFNRITASDAIAFLGGGSDGFAVSQYAKNSALPVTLQSFTGRWDGQNALLQWTTATEINTRHFILERSLNGTGFTAVANLPASGNSSTTKAYQYTDKDAASLVAGGERLYYRLKTTDRDGKVSLSGIIILNKRSETGLVITLFPNPANGVAHLLLTGVRFNAPVTLIIRNIAGNPVIQKQVSNPSESINTLSLSAGWYSVSLYQKETLIQSIPLIIQH